MKTRGLVLSTTLALLVGIASADPLSGNWVLNVGRTHYGGGAEARTREIFICHAAGQLVRCTITSARRDGRRIVGAFAAAYDGKPHVATGIPDVDQVTLHQIDAHIADALFSYKGKPVFAYRAIKSDDGRSLTIVAVDPISRTILHSIVVYDRQ